MALLDIGVIILALIFLLRGIWLGLVNQLAVIIALIAGFIAAGRYSYYFSDTLLPFVDSTKTSFIITYILLFLLSYLLIILLGFALKKVVNLTMLNWFDRLMGAVFGLVKAALVATLLFMVLAALVDSTSPLVNKGLAAPWLSKSSQILLELVKDEKLRSRFIPTQPAISPESTTPVPQSEASRRNAE